MSEPNAKTALLEYVKVRQRLEMRDAEMRKRFKQAGIKFDAIPSVLGVFRFSIMSADEAIQDFEKLNKECVDVQLKFRTPAGVAVDVPRLECFQAEEWPKINENENDNKNDDEKSTDKKMDQDQDGDVQMGMCRSKDEKEATSTAAVVRNWYAWSSDDMDIKAGPITPTVRKAAKRLNAMLPGVLDEKYLNNVSPYYHKAGMRIGTHQDKMFGCDANNPSDIFTVSYMPSKGDNNQWIFRIRNLAGRVINKDAKGAGDLRLQPGDAVLVLYEANQLYFHEAFAPQDSSKPFVPRRALTLRSMKARACPSQGTWWTPDGKAMTRAQAASWIEKERAKHFDRYRLLACGFEEYTKLEDDRKQREQQANQGVLTSFFIKHERH